MICHKAVGMNSHAILNETEKDVTCQIESYNKRGEFIELSSNFIFKNSPDGFPQTIVKSNEAEDAASFLDLTLTNPGGYYVLQCFLPPGLFDPNPPFTNAAFIATYQMDEASN
jgi:hypothetical protein